MPMTITQMKKRMQQAIENRKQADPEIRKAEMVCEVVHNCLITSELPSPELKAEFRRLRKEGYIEYNPDQQILRVNYANAKNN